MCRITDNEINDFFGEYERPQIALNRSFSNLRCNFRRNIKMIKKDCFAYRHSRCNVLTEMVCRYGECSFYKTRSQDKKDREKYRLKKEYQPKIV